MARRLLIVTLLPLATLATIPAFPPPSYVFASDARDVCGWLELVAYRFHLDTVSGTVAYVHRMMASIPEKTMDWLRVGTSLRDRMLAKVAHSASSCPSTWAPRADALAERPWPLAESANINGETDTENHKVMYNNSLVEVVNVYAEHREQYHSHRKLSIFVSWGIDLCQDDHKYDGKVVHVGAPDCATTYNASMPQKLDVIFMSSEWLHANVLFKPMSLPQSPNCPHNLAPEKCDGFLTRFVFHDNALPRIYPTDPLQATSAPSITV